MKITAKELTARIEAERAAQEAPREAEAQAARVHARLARLQAERDAEALNATERVYLGPRLLGKFGQWVCADPNTIVRHWRRTRG